MSSNHKGKVPMTRFALNSEGRYAAAPVEESAEEMMASCGDWEMCSNFGSITCVCRAKLDLL